ATRGVQRVLAVVPEQEGGRAHVHRSAADVRGLELDGVVARLAVDDEVAAGLEVAQVRRADLDVERAAGVGRLDGDGVRARGAADDQGGLAGVGRVGLKLRGADRDRLRGGGAGATVLVRGRDLHGVGTAGGVDVAYRGARRARDRLGGAVAPGDAEGE